MTDLEALYILGFRYIARDKFTVAYKSKPIPNIIDDKLEFSQDVTYSDGQEIETRIMFLDSSFDQYVKQDECIEIPKTSIEINLKNKLLAYKALGFRFICRDEDNTLHAYKDSVIRYICVSDYDSAERLNETMNDSETRFIARSEQPLSFFSIRPDKWRFENFYDMPKDSDFDFITWLDSPFEI